MQLPTYEEAVNLGVGGHLTVTVERDGRPTPIAIGLGGRNVTILHGMGRHRPSSHGRSHWMAAAAQCTRLANPVAGVNNVMNATRRREPAMRRIPRSFSFGHD